MMHEAQGVGGGGRESWLWRHRVFVGITAAMGLAYCALLASWYFNRMQADRAQRKVEAAVRHMGGRVMREGRELFSPPNLSIDLAAVDVSDADIAALDALPPRRLTALSLGPNHITDKGLARIARFTNLHILALGEKAPHGGRVGHAFCARITDDGLRALGGLEKLANLRLDGTSIGDGGLVHLNGLGRSFMGVHTLSLAQTRVTDTGLAQLPEVLPVIQFLDLDGCPITDAGLEDLQRLPRLEQVSLNDTAITDEAVRHLLSIGNLRVLSLDRTQITDEGLNHLASYPSQIRMISVRGTPVTDSTVGALVSKRAKSAVPLRIEH